MWLAAEAQTVIAIRMAGMAGLFPQDVIAEEVTILPGLEEGASLLWLSEYVHNDDYDVLVIDNAIVTSDETVLLNDYIKNAGATTSVYRRELSTPKILSTRRHPIL